MSEYQGKRYYFCADACKKRFDANPAAFLARPGKSGMAQGKVAAPAAAGHPKAHEAAKVVSVGGGKLALEIGGGMAYARIGGIERFFRDVHGALYHPLPTAKQEMFTGEHML